jgi:hypothetical protein
MRLNVILAFSHVFYMVLGSIIIIEEERVNSYEPVEDLGVPFLFTVFCSLFGAIMWIQFKKEKIKASSTRRIRMRFRSLFYLSDVLVLILSLVLMGFLSLIIVSDSLTILDAANSFEPPDDVSLASSTLNFVTLVLFSAYILLFMISTLINHSHDKDKWIKFINIQILFQGLLVLLYIIITYYIINQFNQHMILIEDDLRLSYSDLRQGAIKYYISMFLSIGFLRISK